MPQISVGRSVAIGLQQRLGKPRCQAVGVFRTSVAPPRIPRHPIAVRAEAEKESSSSSGSAAPAQQQPPQQQDEDGDTLIERQLASKRRKPKEGKAGPTVISPVRDQVYSGGPLTDEQKMENRVVSSLALLFIFIFLEGIFLAASGFLSEGVDQFAQDVVFPLFSPSIGLFLLASAGYGVWKAYFQGRGAPPQS